jgi:hypothetical protein
MPSDEPTRIRKILSPAADPEGTLPSRHDSELRRIIETKKKEPELPVEKNIEARPKESSTGSINSTEKKPVAPDTSPHKPSSGNPDPVLSTSNPQTPVAGKHPPPQQMARRDFLNIIYSVSLFVAYMSAILRVTKQNENVGNDRQESDSKNYNAPSDSSTHIRNKMVGFYLQVEKKHLDLAYIQLQEIRTTLSVFRDSSTGKLRAIETSFWHIFYTPDHKKVLVGAFETEWLHTESNEQDTSGDTIKMGGHNRERYGLEVTWELSPEENAELKKAIDYIQSYPTITSSEMSLDSNNNIKREQRHENEAKNNKPDALDGTDTFNRQYLLG